jgi:hypothetical protein
MDARDAKGIIELPIQIIPSVLRVLGIRKAVSKKSQ